MTEKQKAEITRRARQDADAVMAGWTRLGSPYQQQDANDLWQEHFELAMKEGKK